jgi:hypothetical protein
MAAWAMVAVFHSVSVAWAADGPPANPAISTEIFQQSFTALFGLFVLAVLLESALALVFNWRPFVESLQPRAVRPVISLIGALIFVKIFNLDITVKLAGLMSIASANPTIPGKILTAMVLAGGSSGVNNLLIALGYRSVRTPETTVQKPPPNKAWVAIRALKGNAVGDLLVFLGPPGSLTLMGAIKERSKPGSLWSWFVSDRGRLPNYGGHAVTPGQQYMLEVRGVDEKGTPLPPVVLGPTSFADGAIVDLDVKV